MNLPVPYVSVALIALTLIALSNQGRMPVALAGNRLIQLVSTVWLLWVAYVLVTWFLRTQV